MIETSLEVQGVAMAAAGNGDPRARFASRRRRRAVGVARNVDLVAFWDALLERYIGAARAELAEEADAVWAEGRAMPFDDAVELALKLE